VTTENTLSQTLLWFQKAIPKPQTKNFRTQLGVHFEEVGEMIATLTSDDMDMIAYIHNAQNAMTALSKALKESNDQSCWVRPQDLVEHLDALCDQIVTVVGCAHMIDADIVGGMDEVNRSNFSKFDEDGNPIFDANRKIIKGPNYSKADLSKLI
jgi:predicted HAD superfamily Cof-like phosphohydrolase